MIHFEQQFYKLNLFSTQVVWFEVTIKDPEDDYYDYEYGLGELFHPPRGSIDQRVNNSTHSCYINFDVKTLILNFHLIFYEFHILESEDYEEMRSRNEDTEAIYEVNE